MPKIEIKAFIREFERITEVYRSSVDPAVSSIVIHPDLASRMNILKILFDRCIFATPVV